MQRHESLKPTTWECKQNLAFTTWRRKLWRKLGAVFRSLAERKESKVEEGYLMPDRVQWIKRIKISRPGHVTNLR
jgi:hypothetical protein